MQKVSCLLMGADIHQNENPGVALEASLRVLDESGIGKNLVKVASDVV
ncbi:MAG: hypothetical protein WCK34_11220 [Bacteroidota bacterium]